MSRIYLDHAASSPLRPEAAEAMQRAWQFFGNPSSLHSDGRKAGELLEQCRDRVAEVFACKSNDVIFNSGGSEGDTHALLGAAELINTVRWGAKHYGVAKKPLRIAVSAIEHKAVLHAAEKLAAAGHQVSYIPVTPDGVIRLDWLESAISKEHLDLVSIMAINNEVGTTQPTAEIAKLCQTTGAVFHCDAVQVPGHGLQAVLRNAEIPLLTVSGHKFGGPRGAGILLQRRQGLAQVLDCAALPDFPALICGGHQEHGCRAGTENLPAIAGMTKALELAENSVLSASLLPLQRLIEGYLQTTVPGLVIHGAAVERSSGIISCALPGVLGRELQKKLDRLGVSVGLGSACTGCDRGVSHVLAAMGVEPEQAEATIRISLGWTSSGNDVERFLTLLMQCSNLS